MFKNCGGKIKGLAILFFILTILLFIAGGILVIVLGTEYGYHRYEGYYIAGGIVLMLLGPIIAWLGTILLYGYGELVEDTEANRKANEEIRQILLSMPGTQPTEPVRPAPAQNAYDRPPERVNPMPPAPDAFAPPPEKPAQSAVWFCRFCGRKNDGAFCINCGKPRS